MIRMNRPFLVVAAVAAGALACAFGVAKQAVANQEPKAASVKATDFEFMSGSWQMGQMGKSASVTEEHWMLPNGGSLIGMSRTIANGKTAFFEFLRLEEAKDGVDYVAQPAGRPPTRFRCTSLADRKAVFENPQHDFPTKITYERKGDELIATVSGPPTAKEKPQTFRYTRASEEVRLPD